MSRARPRSLVLLILFGFLTLIGCAPSAPAGSSAAGSGLAQNPTPTITPVVLLPSDPLPPRLATAVSGPPGARLTPPSTALAPTPRATFAAGPQASAVAILMYHQIKDLPANASADDLTWTVSPAALDAQLGYLAEHGYVTISLDELLDGFAGKSALPPKAVVLTFDDGWKTQYTNALPLLRKRNQTATFYVVSSYMGYGAYFDWTMTEEIKNAGMTIGGHTIDHANLTTKSAAELDNQLRDSKAALEKRLGITVSHLAYPYGAYNDAVVEAVKRAGYRSATTISPALAKNPVSPYLLPRLRVSYKETLADFAKKLP